MTSSPHDYLASLSPEQMAEVLTLLPPEERKEAEEIVEEMEYRRIFKTPVSPENPRPWLEFLKYTITQDEHDESTPFKPLVQAHHTVQEELPYAIPLVDKYLREPLLAVSKSRQIRITWILTAIDLWTVMREPGGKRVGLTAQKEATAVELLDRCWTIYRHLPQWIQDRCPLEMTGNRPSQTRMKFSNGSTIAAFPEGSEQFRSYTFSRWRNEEAKTQTQLPLMIRGALPTLKGGGQTAQVSTPGDNTFKDIVFDRDFKTHVPHDPDRKFPRASATNPISIWTNPGNGYVVIEIHYTADPTKRGPEAEAEFRKGISNDDYEQEYNLNYEVVSGEIALQFYLDKKEEILADGLPLHMRAGPNDPFTPASHLDFFASADYGIRSPYACLFGVEDPKTGILWIFDEYYRGGYKPLGEHLTSIKARKCFKNLQVYVLDKSCWALNQQAVNSTSVAGRTRQGITSIAELHIEEGVHPSPATVVFDAVKVSAMQRVWAVGTPSVRILSRKCINLCKELEGIRWQEKPPGFSQSAKVQKLVDKDNHAWDALTYLVLHRRAAPVQIEEPDSPPVGHNAAAAAQRKAKAQAYVEQVMGKNQTQTSYVGEETGDVVELGVEEWSID